MVRVISVLIIFYICLMFGMKDISYTESGKHKVSMKDHIEDVKLKHPEKYEAMIKKAEGNITDCESCHDVIGKEKKNSNQAPTDFPGK
jgi:hypothetical protein